MKVKLVIEDINSDDENFFTGMIYKVIDRMSSEESGRKVDSVIINYQKGEEEEIR